MSVLSNYGKKGGSSIYQELKSDVVTVFDVIEASSKVVIKYDEANDRIFGSLVYKHGGLLAIDRIGDLGLTVGEHSLEEFFDVATPTRAVTLRKVDKLPEDSNLTEEEFKARPQEIDRLEWNAVVNKNKVADKTPAVED